MKTPNMAALLVALSLPLAHVNQAEAQESSAITSIYTGLLTSVAQGAGSAGVGWAMSALGLAGGDSAALAEIADELATIDQDLKAIDATLVQLLTAIDNQTCVSTETQTALTQAVDNITTLFNNYQTQFIQPAQAGDPVVQSQLVAWMSAVLDQSKGIAANLTAIHNALYVNPSNVILECIVSITQSYVSGDGPKVNIIDDRPYYTPILSTLNYYYGVQLQGASILVEALHLQACQTAAASDCDFSTVATGISPSDAASICEDPLGTVATFCDEAREVVTDPGTGTGMYERVLAQLIDAGAPYSSDILGLLWGTSYLFAKDLQDFTNHAATASGQTSNCPLPLTSMNPCGPTVGSYDWNFGSQTLSYGGYPADGENFVWTPAKAEQLVVLLAPFNDQSKESGLVTNGTLGEYLASIDFNQSVNNGWIVTTANTGKNGVSGSTAICFMDTAAPRDKTKQPLCDQSSIKVQGTDNLLKEKTVSSDPVFPITDWVERDFTKSLISQPQFYVAKYELAGTSASWQTKPAWLASEQTNSAKQSYAHQFHWPLLDVTKLSCSVRGQGHTNPGGEYTMCGSDLQAYIDALMPPPDTGTSALFASADTTLHRALPNSNDGAGRELGLGGGDDAREIVLRFHGDRIQQLMESGEVVAAALHLSQVSPHGRARLQIRPLPDAFVEGSGNLVSGDGEGTGATWHCAEDADIGNDVEECLQHWARSTFSDSGSDRGHWRAKALKALPAERRLAYDRATGRVSWDVSEDIRSGTHTWLIRTLHRSWRRGTSYHSREGAAELRAPVLAPMLLLER